MTVTTTPATDKQMALIHKLIGEKNTGHFGEDTLADLQTVQSGGTLPKKFASQLISALLAAPKKVVAAKATAAAWTLTPGMYVAPNGEIVKVKPTQDKQRLYAQVMVSISGERLTVGGEVVNWDWQYAPGLIKEIQPSWKMDAEQAHALGIQSGRCLWCKKALKDATSVSLAMGPTCRKMFA
jgi:hypothetical protein